MSTHTQTCYHIVFSTKDRQPVVRAGRREDLSRYIWGTLKNRQSHLYRINGTEDQLHILTSLHASVSLANLVKDVTISHLTQVILAPMLRRFKDTPWPLWRWRDG